MQMNTNTNNRDTYNNNVHDSKNRPTYQFVTHRDTTMLPKTPEEICFVYQICTFPNPKTQRYHMRKFTLNGNNEFIDLRNYNLSKKQCKKFFKIKKSNEYKCFHTYSLDNIEYPKMADISLSRSNLLSQNNDYTGFAPF